jgi:hypothetical protein
MQLHHHTYRNSIKNHPFESICSQRAAPTNNPDHITERKSIVHHADDDLFLARLDESHHSSYKGGHVDHGEILSASIGTLNRGERMGKGTTALHSRWVG